MGLTPRLGVGLRPGVRPFAFEVVAVIEEALLLAAVLLFLGRAPVESSTPAGVSAVDDLEKGCLDVDMESAMILILIQIQGMELWTKRQGRFPHEAGRGIKSHQS
jgi:hypothetical protein